MRRLDSTQVHTAPTTSTRKTIMFTTLRSIIASILAVAGLVFGAILHPETPAHTTDTTHASGSAASLSSTRNNGKTPPQPTPQLTTQPTPTPDAPDTDTSHTDTSDTDNTDSSNTDAADTTDATDDAEHIVVDDTEELTQPIEDDGNNTDAATPQQPTTLLHQGDVIRIDNRLCTLGYIDPVARTATLAAHCVPSDHEAELYNYETDTPIGKIVSHHNGATDNARNDVLTFNLYDTVTLTDYPNPYSGNTLLTLDDVQFGDKACSYSAMTQSVRCGVIYNTDSTVVFGSPELGGVQGDSGGPMWLVDDENNPKGLLGVYSILTGIIVGYTNPLAENTLGNTPVQGNLPDGTIVHFAD